MNLTIAEQILINEYILKNLHEREIERLLSEAKNIINIRLTNPSVEYIYDKLLRYYKVNDIDIKSKYKKREFSRFRAKFIAIVAEIYFKDKNINQSGNYGLRKKMAELINKKGENINNILKSIRNEMQVNKKLRDEVSYLAKKIYIEFLNEDEKHHNTRSEKHVAKY